MIVSGQTGFLELAGLFGREHSQRRAHLHVESTVGKDRASHQSCAPRSSRIPSADNVPDAFDHLQNPLEPSLSPAQISPRSSHTEPRRPVRLGLARLDENGLDLTQFLCDQSSFIRVPRRLGAVAAVLATSTNLDIEQSAQLDLIGRMVQAMDRSLRGPGKRRERKAVELVPGSTPSLPAEAATM